MTDATATRLGFASSQRDRHTHTTPTPPRGERCSACRWTEITISLEEAEGQDPTFVIVTEGKSALEGETDRTREERTTSAHWVVEYLSRRDSSGELYMPVVAKKALAEAAAHNSSLDDAYVNRVID